MTNNFHPKVSIVIPVYNGSNYLKEAIDSALSQTYDNVEVIVVNDGSNDNGKTDKICKSYGDKIRYFVKENGGVATALNKGIEEMKGEYFSWLSHDDVYYPNKIEEQIKCLNELTNKNTILFSDVDYIDRETKLIRNTNYSKLYPISCLNSGTFSALKGILNGCSLLINKRVFDKVGLFNEKLQTSNDYEMWFRIVKFFDFRFIEKTLIKYRLHNQQGTKTFDTKERSKEADLVWSKFILSSVSKVRKLETDLFLFYFDLANRMKQDSREKSFRISKRIFLEEYKKNVPEISVIMPCYNAGKYLNEAINSILSQTYPNFELIIIDDASTDESSQIIAKFKKIDFRIKTFKHKLQMGEAGAMNTGLRLALSKKYITRMDADDISLPTRLEKQRSFLELNKNYVFCSVNMEAFGIKNIPFLFEKQDTPLEWLFLFLNPMASAATMYRAKIIKKNKLQFGNYKVACDYDFLCKVLHFGKPYMLYEESLYRYRIYGDSIFQKNIELAMQNSVEINDNLLKKLTNKKPPKFHKLLTIFTQDFGENKLEFSLFDITYWVQTLLDLGKKRWNWSQREYQLAKEYSETRILRFVSRPELVSVQSELKIVTERLLEIDKNNKELYSQNILLKQEIESQKRSLLSVLLKIKHFPKLLQKQGLKKTLRNIWLKINCK